MSLDNVRYDSKPNGNEIGQIKHRIKNFWGEIVEFVFQNQFHR